MNLKFVKASVIGVILFISSSANAGLIDSASILLDDTSATKLENWLGQGDMDWNSIWYGSTNATAESWHSAVDGVGATFTLYDVTYKGNDYLVGGYTDLDWGTNGWQTGNLNSFIFNLTLNIKHDSLHSEIYSHSNYFAAFGNGHDLVAKYSIDSLTHYAAPNCGSYGITGTLSILDGVQTGCYADKFTLNALETFSVNEATSAVPEPSTLAIFILGIIGLASRKIKKQF